MGFESGAEAPKSTRENIKNDAGVAEMLHSGLSHEKILSELEDMIEDQHSYDKVVKISDEAIAILKQAPEDEQDTDLIEQYERNRGYAQQVIDMNPDEGYE